MADIAKILKQGLGDKARKVPSFPVPDFLVRVIAMRAMVKLTHSLPDDEVAARAYRLYEEFRPVIPAGVTGLGAAGELDLDLIEGLSERR